MSEWPDEWVSAKEKMGEEEADFTNDHGILYLCGDVRSGEWLHMHDIPDRLENRC